MSLIEHFIERAKQTPKRVVLPEGNDERIVRAAHRLASEGIAHPIIICTEATEFDLPLNGITVIDPTNNDHLQPYIQAYAAKRDGVSEGMARRLVKRPLMFGAMMVSEGDADAMVAGATRPTTQVISAGALAIGYAEGLSQASSFFIMVLPGDPEKILVYADAAVVVDPDPTQLAEIAVITARNARILLDIEPRVALLSFSTHGSATHEHVTKVQKAVEIAHQMAPDLSIDGELQADAALSERVAQKKCPDSPVAGSANVLIFPDLDAANCAYKLTQYLANAQAIGPIMQGFKNPLNDLSRGATEDDIVAVAAIATLQANS